MAWTYNNRVIREGRSWKDDSGVTHPTSWGRWSEADKSAAGLVWADGPEPFDSRFYWDAETPKELEDLVATSQKQVTRQAHNILTQTDWVVIRAMELSQDIPEWVSSYRSRVRQAEAEKLAMLKEAKDFDSFVTMVSNNGEESSNFNVWPELEGATAYDN